MKERKAYSSDVSDEE